jgi:hypothetical protein
MMDDVEVNPDGTFVFDTDLDFHPDGRSLLQWFSKERPERPEQRPPKKKICAKVSGTPPRKPRAVEPAKTTPLKLAESCEKPRDMKSMNLFGKPKCAVRVIFKGVEGPPLYVHLPQKKTST